jgi:UDP-GlcNAc:undecaprenyl-phosphate GlcNAc-1-phosphate transferase
MATFAAILIVPWLLALVLTPAVIRFAQARGFLDYPTERKAHKAPVAILGGVAVFASIVLGLLAVAVFVPPVRALLWGYESLGAMGLGAGLMVALGAWDDLYDMRPLHKLAGQIAIASLTWAMGFRVGSIELPFDFFLTAVAPVSLVVTVGWIVIVSNAFNLIDGIDGLTAGVSVITALTVFLLANQNGATVPVIAALALSGALAGFLRFNLPPARIFLGDAGALSIGYLTAVLAMASYQKSPAAVALAVPLLVLGLPLLDAILAVIRRGLQHLRTRGAEGLRPGEIVRAITLADRGHLHHLLLRNGLSVPQSLAVLYGVCLALAALGLSTRDASSSLRWGFFLGLIAAGYAALRWLERRALQRDLEIAARSAPLAVTSRSRLADGSRRSAG